MNQSGSAPSTPPAQTSEPSSDGAPTASASNLEIIGNKNSKVYHLPGCAGYKRVSEQNQVKFGSREEAEKAGYKLAGNCSAKNGQAPTESESTPSTPAESAAPAASESASSAASSSGDQKMIIGNKNSKIYHLPDCAGYTKVSEPNQVKFTSAAEAEKAGFRLAKNCSAKSN